MKEDTIAKIKEETDTWAYMANLPAKWHGFVLQREPVIGKDKYDLYRYVNEDWHKSAIVYFHEETHEYKVRLKIGLIEFVRIEFITGKLSVFEELLTNQFEQVLKDMASFNPATLSSIVVDKKLPEWQWGSELPAENEGFTLFIRPAEPVKINNGSYIVIDYVDFALESSFTVYYNIYRDEFFAEARIWNIPDVNYDFDANDLQELEEKLRTRMLPRLRQVRGWAEEQKETHHGSD
ncbi:MAG: hypothetical protein K6F95_08790 [Selenomonas sp.]|uniref:hypothetical protein n=1 Tax=Selenomonas sp. TaxID=2053611 RepID=UPI0025CBE2B4|nr:hypothetical protein [Selenomonas sp.]MCR5757987.1 hypothetical protein [Selenomonas sp.]